MTAGKGSLKRLSGFLKRQACLLPARLGDTKYRKLAASYNIAGYRRIYLIHIRKTGGTTLNNLFLSLGHEDYKTLYGELGRTTLHRLVRNGRIFVGWTRELINAGNYYYAFSHIPYHELHLPDRTFTIVCFRDPARRVISHYNMLMEYSRRHVSHPCMAVEGKWLGRSFHDFLDRMPKAHMLNQLYMLSERFDVEEALERVRSISHVMFTEKYASGLEGLNRKTGLDLQPAHIRRSGYKAEIPEQEQIRLRAMLESEYQFIERIKQMIAENADGNSR